MLDEVRVGVQKHCHLALCKRLLTHTGQGVGHSISLGTEKQAYGIRKMIFKCKMFIETRN